VRGTLLPLVARLWTHSVELSASGVRLTFPFFIRERSDDRALRRYERVRAAMAGKGRVGYGPSAAIAAGGRFVRGEPRRR
jgi:hypothetical protein